MTRNDAELLMKDLRIAESCDQCERYDGHCKGHLSWLCRAIRKQMERREDEHTD